MKIVTHGVDEHVPAVVASVRQASALDGRAHIVDYVVHVLVGKQAGDVA